MHTHDEKKKVKLPVPTRPRVRWGQGWEARVVGPDPRPV